MYTHVHVCVGTRVSCRACILSSGRSRKPGSIQGVEGGLGLLQTANRNKRVLSRRGEVESASHRAVSLSLRRPYRPLCLHFERQLSGDSGRDCMQRRIRASERYGQDSVYVRGQRTRTG